ncbi:MAG TPA: hypothetical protein VHA82_03470 [Ramlibacter sp.]|uniref:hypothetical protein n=1 Tax=Ramlibacter sp. TaxID=1917967 RepID=UPI002BAD6E55|nr:hypothetical protein [Ramlibacter sp.]HVZ42847.1 hypothetical protein [Ramlibacter sp.]
MPLAARRLARASAAFVGIGLLLYLLLLAGAEALVYRNGHSNPFFKIETLDRPSADWLILGTSHAMPLDFGGFGATMREATGQTIVNLAAQGTGPVYSRLVLRQYLRRHKAANVLYVADAFAFQSRAWNEDRFGDAKLLARTPFDASLAAALAGYVRTEGVSWRAWLDYVSGFSKINNRQRFELDAWEGEAQFERQWRASSTSVKKRIDYLYPDGAAADTQATQARYLAELDRLLRDARASGARVTVIQMPVPAVFRAQLPRQADFEAALARTASLAGAEYHDYSASIDEPRFYFDSDHLGRTGVQMLFDRELKPLLLAGRRGPQP